MDIKIRTIANRKSEDEKLILDVINDCDLDEFIVFDTTFDNEGNVSNLHRHCYFFPVKQVKKGDVVILYSKKGHDYKTTMQNSLIPAHVFYWGLDIQVWNNEEDRCILVHMDDADVKSFE